MSASEASAYTSFELQRETELGTPHIVIQEHLDLTQLGPVPLTSTGGERIVVQNTTLSIRVRTCQCCPLVASGGMLAVRRKGTRDVLEHVTGLLRTDAVTVVRTLTSGWCVGKLHSRTRHERQRSSPGRGVARTMYTHREQYAGQNAV